MFRQRTLLAGAAVCGSLLLSLNVRFKNRPDPGEVKTTSNEVRQTFEQRGTVAANFELELLDGGRFSLDSAVGRKVVVLAFFATWCGPCRAELPELKRFVASLPADRVAFVGVDDDETKETVAGYVRAEQVAWPIGIDRGHTVEKAYGVTSFPTLVVIGADGRIALHEIGAVQNADVSLLPVVRKELEALAQGRGVDPGAWLAEARKAGRDLTPRAPARDALPRELRVAKIAHAMPCPCGCDEPVDRCACQTARKIRKALDAYEFREATDDEVIRELGKRFCPRGT